MAYRIAQLLSLRKMHAEATPYFAQAVRLLPLSSDFQLNLALNEFQLARRLNAVQRLEKLIEQDPSYVPAYANLGYMHLLDGNARQAGICYEKALDLDPDHPQTLLNAVGLQLHLKRPQEAKRLITRILKRYPQDVRALALRDQMAATP
jgi:tetratricopeptide (TPR) repeat protein